MSRFLFVVPPFTGHVNQPVSVARELELRGHGVAWVAYAQHLGPLLGEHGIVFGLDDPHGEVAAMVAANRATTARGLEGLRFPIAETFVPLARLMLDPVEAAIDAFRPDMVVADQHAYAGAIAARRRGIRLAISAPTFASHTSPRGGALPQLATWIEEQEAALDREAGLAPDGPLEVAGHPVLTYATKELIGDADLPPWFHLVGPALAHRGGDERLDPALLGPRPRILVTLGTIAVTRGSRFFAALAEAFAGRQGSAIVAAGPELVPQAPPNVVARGPVPQLALLPHLDAVVCHGGANTIVEALAHGLPLVVAPIWADQLAGAGLVVRSGAGLRVSFPRATAATLGTALDAVLGDPGHRAAADRIRRSFDAAGGTSSAADVLEQAAAQPSPISSPKRLR